MLKTSAVAFIPRSTPSFNPCEDEVMVDRAFKHPAWCRCKHAEGRAKTEARSNRDSEDLQKADVCSGDTYKLDIRN